MRRIVTRRRLGALAMLVTMTGGLSVGLPGVAGAATQIPCPTGAPPAAQAVHGPDGIILPPPRYIYRYTLVSATPTFNASDGRIVDNALNDPISATFTSLQSRTWRIVVTVGTEATLADFLKSTVSVQIVQERTTAIGVNATVMVPAHTRVLGQYGVEAFEVVYDVQTIYWFAWRCSDLGTQRVNTNAPTFVEGWRFTSG